MPPVFIVSQPFLLCITIPFNCLTIVPDPNISRFSGEIEPASPSDSRSLRHEGGASAVAQSRFRAKWRTFSSRGALRIPPRKTRRVLAVNELGVIDSSIKHGREARAVDVRLYLSQHNIQMKAVVIIVVAQR